MDKKAIVSLMAYNINRDYDRRSMYMHKENDVKYVEAIKLAAGGVQYRSLSVKNTLIGKRLIWDRLIENSFLLQ